MQTVWVGKATGRSLKSVLRSLLCLLLVDIIPVVLLLLAMAYGMAFVSHKLSEPRSVELQTSVNEVG